MREELTVPLLIEQLRHEQCACWEQGDRVPVETLLERYSTLANNNDAILDVIYAEVLLREEYQEQPTLIEYRQRFPLLADALERMFQAHDVLTAFEDSVSTAPLADTLEHPNHPPSNLSTKPQQLGAYAINAELGRGGMGVVYLATHTVTGHRAAVKVLRTTELWPTVRQRFIREAQAVAALSHANIVRIYDVADDSTPFIALEYVAGGTLANYLNGTPISNAEASELLQPLAEAMAHAHAANIIHRDLKPSNVLLEGRPQAYTPKIADFGLAKQLDATHGQTQTGDILGTPSYMAPEQALGAPNQGPGIDVYALGAILYEMLTGRPPFKGVTLLDTLAQVREQEPIPPTQLNPTVARDLETIALKCLAKDPTRRYASCADLAADVQRYRRGEAIHARRVGAVERTYQWFKRRPAVAVLMAMTIVGVGLLVGIWASFTLRLQEQQREITTQRDRATTEAKRAQEQAEVALTQTAEAHKRTLEAQRQNERAAYLLSLTATSVDDIAIAARGESALNAKGDKGSAGAVLFKMASFYAKACHTLQTDPILLPADRERLAEQFALSAIRLLNCADKTGYFLVERTSKREQLESNTDFASLRSRADYRAFIQRLR